MLNIVRFLEKYKDSAQKDDMIFEDCGSKSRTRAAVEGSFHPRFCYLSIERHSWGN